VPRKTAENTVKHRGGGVGSVVANHRGGGEISMVITTLNIISLLIFGKCCSLNLRCLHAILTFFKNNKCQQNKNIKNCSDTETNMKRTLL